MLPRVAHDADTVASVVVTYLDGDAPYRGLAEAVLGTPRQAATFNAYADPPYPSPTPATCFRWVAAFAADARAWWRNALTTLLKRGSYRVLVPPLPPADRAQSDAKRVRLQDACQAVDAWRQLADHKAVPRDRWLYLMRHAPCPPTGIGPTRGLLVPP